MESYGVQSEGDGGAPAPASVLVLTEPGDLPPEPVGDQLYQHRTKVGPALRALWDSREVILTLAERDIRVQYKQAVLGFAWAVLAPVATLVIMTLVFKRVKAFNVGDIPYPLYAYSGILAWNFFSSSLGSGGNSLLANKVLLAKVHFPRECFPLAELVESSVSTALALIVLALLFAIHHMLPHVQVLWAPVFVAIELMFCAGVVMAASALLVHVRDLTQVLPIVMQLGMFATPVIWPFSKIPAAWQPVYGFVNPLGPIIDDIRRTMLLGLEPQFGLLAVAALGAFLWLVVGYVIFKRLEAELADIA